MPPKETLTDVLRLEKEARAYRHYNAQYDNRAYHELTQSLSEATSTETHPSLPDWEWGNLIINAALELCGHPDYQRGVVDLFTEIAALDIDSRPYALRRTIAFLWLFSAASNAQDASAETGPPDLPF